MARKPRKIIPIPLVGEESEYTKVLNRLNELEQYLSVQFDEIDYIGEVNLRREQYLQMVRDIKYYYEVNRITATTRKLKNDWPHVFICFLSITAAYNDNRGYWQAVVDSLGLTSTQSINAGKNHWGQIYLQLLEQFNLDTFADAKFSFPFVTPIRLQGGIPRYSLPDFFEYFILPSVEKPDLVLLDDHDAYEEVQKKSYAKFYADKVIKLYMQNGGEFAERFFASCRKMAWIAGKGEPLPAPSELGLRPFVVQLFEDYLSTRIERTSDQRIRSPRLIFRPHQPYYEIYLPEQVISEGMAHQGHFWRIRFFENGQEIKKSQNSVRIRDKGIQVLTNAVDLIVDYPYQKAIVEFGRFDKASPDKTFKSIKSWPLRLLPEKELPQVMAFSYEGRVISVGEGLPADYCWLLIPEGREVLVEGKGIRVEELSQYWQPWEAWKAELWDLSGCQVLEIMDSSKQRKIVFPVVQPIPEPTLMGGERIPSSRMVNEIPLIIGKPPRVCFPLLIDQDLDSGISIEKWDIKITSVGPAIPNIEQRFDLDDEVFSPLAEDNVLAISLEHCLGDAPAGEFLVQLIHQDGKEFDLPFRIWPVLKLEGIDPLIIPDKEGGKPLNLIFKLPTESYLDPINDSHRPDQQIRIADEQISGHQKHCLVIVPSEETTGSFILSMPTTQDTIHVPLELNIPRLRWAIRFDDSEVQEIKWHTILHPVPLPKIRQSGTVQLLVGAELPRDSKYYITMSVRFPGLDNDLQTLSSEKLTHQEPRCRFIINTLLETINAHPTEPFFDIVLRIEGEDLSNPVHLPIVRLTRTLDVRNVLLEHDDLDTTYIHWNEPNPLKQRRVQIWSIWQPWREPIEIKLPDDPNLSNIEPDWYMYPVSPPGEVLIEGTYSIRFIAIPTWVDRPVPSFPPLDETKILRVGNPEERLEELQNLIDSNPRDLYALHYERACILDDLSSLIERDQEISWCSSQAKHAEIKILINFYHWLEGKDSHTQKALRMRMVQPDWLLNLFLKIDNPDIRTKYLEPLINETSLPANSAKIILDHAIFPEIVSLAIQALIDDEDTNVVKYIMDQIEAGKFSVLGAFDFYKPYADFVLPALWDLPVSNHRSRLLKTLSVCAEIPMIIFPGWWIHCDAGWGIIESVQEMDQEIECFKVDQGYPRLFVQLRPGEMSINIVIDLAKGEIRFPDDEQIFVCTHHTGCYNFITNDFTQILERHNRVAHRGLRGAYRPWKTTTYTMRCVPEYNPDEPDEIFM